MGLMAERRPATSRHDVEQFPLMTETETCCVRQLLYPLASLISPQTSALEMVNWDFFPSPHSYL